VLERRHGAQAGLDRMRSGLAHRPSRLRQNQLDHPAPARDLFSSPLFLGRRSSVERTCGQWFVLSAEHGLVDPDTVLSPYDVRLADAAVGERRAWARWS
jgi:hypothetical protein